MNSAIRNLISALGSAAVLLGFIGQNEVGEWTGIAISIAGSLGIIGSIAWGQWNEYIAAKRLAVAKIAPVTQAAIVEATAKLTPQEIERVVSNHQPPAQVSVTGKVT